MKKYELSLSRNYVSGWGIEEAIRELLQNAKDSNGEDIIDIDKSSGTITITNKSTSIPSSTLLLGNTSKRDDLDKIGQFGEGYKLALLVLLRDDKEVFIKNGNKNWIPSFEYSDNFECEVLCITETAGNGNDLTFEISGFDSSELDELENEFLGLNGQAYNSIQTSYGEIALDKEKMMPGQENFNRMFSGIWEKENPTIKKEGNNMIESMNLIDLYANKHRESIEKETKEKIEKIRNESSIKKQYDEITQKCKDDLQKLYISQFTDEEIEKVKETLEGLSGYQKELQHKTSICEFGYFINSDFKNDEIKSLENEMINKINELNDLVKTVKAHVGIAKTKEEVEEILTRYGIIDKKGKLVIK